jgi:hypothetical protein
LLEEGIPLSKSTKDAPMNREQNNADDTGTDLADDPGAAPRLHWELVGNPADHARCADVLALLARLREQHPGAGHGTRMVAVLESPDAEPVIRIQTLDGQVFTAVVAELQRLGLTDRMQGQSQAGAEVHAAFF